MDRPQHSDLVTALKELSWSDVKRMAIHLDKSVDFALLKDIEREYPIEERLLYTVDKWLERDCDASWAKVVSALRVVENNALARKIEEHRLQCLKPCAPHGQTESGPPVVSPVELQPSPGPDSLHQLQPENKATVNIRTRLEPAYDHSPSVSKGRDSDGTRAQETTEQETSDCPTVTQLKKDSEISGWIRRRERRQMISHAAIMAAIVGAALAAAESGNYGILLIVAFTGLIAAMVAFGVKLFIVEGVPTGLRKLALIATGAAVVVAVLVGAGTARITAITIARTAATTSRVTVATASVKAADRSVIPLLYLLAGMVMPLGAAVFAVFTAETVLPVLVAVAAAAAVTIGVGAGVMVAAAVASATAAIMAVAAAGEIAARGASQAAARAAAAAMAALAVAVVTAAVGAPVLKTAAVGLAAVVTVAAAAVVAVGSFPAVRLAAAVTVGTVVVTEAAVLPTAIIAVVVGPPAAPAIAAVIIMAAVALELASKLHHYFY